jgi:histidine triad (HIT) family protein
MQEPSIFTKILSGEIKQEIIYQDNLCFVILTHEPFTPGHALVIPVEQVDHLWDVEDALYLHLMEVAKKIALKLRAVHSYERVGLIVEGYGVPHAHIHVFGYEQPLEPTITDHIAHRHTSTPEELKTEAYKLRD